MFNKKRKERIIILDGATGTNLLSKGLKPGESPSILNIRNAGAVLDLQKAYVDAGSDIIMTNTFSANPFNVRKNLKEVLEQGVNIAREASRGKVAIWADIGPLGELTEPYGPLKIKDAQKIYGSICRIIHDNGIKDFFLETFTSIGEAKIAFLSALPYARSIAVSLSLQNNLRTLMGEIPESIAVTFDALGAAAIGLNCIMPEKMIEAVARMRACTNRPLIAKPNAGRVTIKGNRIRNSLNDRQVASYARGFIKAGASMIGGCCGTTPEYIRILSRRRLVSFRSLAQKGNFICSGRSVLNIRDRDLIIVGERLNPSGRKLLRNSLQHDDFSIYGSDAKKQEQAGADILDVNAFIAGHDETYTIVKAVREVDRNSRLPILLDCQNFEAATAVMEQYPGIGILNSVPVRERELKKWLPLIKKYGFKVIISLIGKKIPLSITERMENARFALKIAEQVGFRLDHIIFDPLVFTLATEPDQVRATLETVCKLKQQNRLTVLGISNISYGLPLRSLINASFAANAIRAGVNLIIINPLDTQIMETVRSGRALFKGRINDYLAWAKTYRNQTASSKPLRMDSGRIDNTGSVSDLDQAVISGDAERASVLTKQMLGSGMAPQKIIDRHITKALHKVGDNFEKGTMFIPDLLRSAQAAKDSLAAIKMKLPKRNIKGKIILATVKGDIHDIGKNIACMIFESAGYQVIDLGKDVSVRRIIDSVRKHKPDFLGLSALLTTTMPEMENVIKELKKNKLSVKVIIGGPNVSTEYAKKIGAYGAARNVLDGLRLLKSMA